MMRASEQPTIFVSIANYRDSETRATVEDLFAQAAWPERLRVGVLSQVVPGQDDDCLAAPHPQVRQVCIHASQSRGVCWARHKLLAEIRDNEEFVLQIDSHSRFSPGWDVRFLEMLAACPSDRPIVSSYPVAYVPPRELTRPLITVNIAKDFNDKGVLVLKSDTLKYGLRPPSPLPAAFVGAGCLFGPAEAFDQVPYDPFLYFHGEEATISARLWTHGWDIFAPNDVLMYHNYTTATPRRRHWDDHPDWSRMRSRAAQRYDFLLARKTPDDPESLTDIERYGLAHSGTVRRVCRGELRAQDD